MSLFTHSDLLDVIAYAETVAVSSNLGLTQFEPYHTSSGRGLIIRVQNFRGTPAAEYFTGTATSASELKERIDASFTRLKHLAQA